eukprot:scaffold2649_cov137-Cylindrotheca_fusiformis.AAC.5
MDSLESFALTRSQAVHKASYSDNDAVYFEKKLSCFESKAHEQCTLPAGNATANCKKVRVIDAVLQWKSSEH